MIPRQEFVWPALTREGYERVPREPHGIPARYHQGCRCDECRAWKAASRVDEVSAPANPSLPNGDDGWMRDGACVGYNPSVFHPSKNEAGRTAFARSVCAICPVRSECLAYALNHREPYGIWGGKTARERQRMRKASESTRYHGEEISGTGAA